MESQTSSRANSCLTWSEVLSKTTSICGTATTLPQAETTTLTNPSYVYFY